jgi:hypothetical protein
MECWNGRWNDGMILLVLSFQRSFKHSIIPSCNPMQRCNDGTVRIDRTMERTLERWNGRWNDETMMMLLWLL